MARLTIHAQAIIAKQQMGWKSSGTQVDCVIIESALPWRSHFKISVAVCQKIAWTVGFWLHEKTVNSLLSYVFCKEAYKAKVETDG